MADHERGSTRSNVGIGPPKIGGVVALACHGRSRPRVPINLAGMSAASAFVRGLLVIAGLSVAVPACDGTISYYRSSVTRFPAKGPNCWLQTLTWPPERAYVELATFDVHPALGMRFKSDVALTDAIRARACQDGADAILARVGRGGLYDQAVSLRWLTPTVPASSPEEPPAAPSSPPLPAVQP